MYVGKGTFALFAGLFVLMAGVSAVRAENGDVKYTEGFIDRTRSCSVTIQEYVSNNGDAVVRIDGNTKEAEGLLPDGAVPVSDVGFSFVKIADLDLSQTDSSGDIGPVRCTGMSPGLAHLLSQLNVISSTDFDRSFQVSEIKDLIDSASSVSASSVTEFAAQYGIRLPDTDEEGVTRAEGLSQGVYLFAETVSPYGYVPCDPFCIALPRTNISEMSIGNTHYSPGEIWLYDITVYPKSRSVSVQKAIVVPEKNEIGEIIGEKNESSVTACIGDTVKFAVTADVPKLSGSIRNRLYVIEDVMDPGLTYAGDISLTAGESDDTADPLTMNSDYKLETSPDKRLIRITFTKKGLARLRESERESHIFVNYNARLNEDAVIAHPGNTNTASLLYGTDHSGDIKVVSGPAAVFTYMLTVRKTFSPARDHYSDVRFSLSDGKEKMLFVKESDGVYHTAGDDEENEQATLVSPNDSTGILILKGLANGKYTLTEEETVPDYSLLGDSIEIIIRNRNLSVDVQNRKSIDLVHTGGKGLVTVIGVSALLIAIGGLMILRAAKTSHRGSK